MNGALYATPLISTTSESGQAKPQGLNGTSHSSTARRLLDEEPKYRQAAHTARLADQVPPSPQAEKNSMPADDVRLSQQAGVSAKPTNGTRGAVVVDVLDRLAAIRPPSASDPDGRKIEPLRGARYDLAAIGARGSTRVVARPFKNFSEVNDFISSLSRLQGVHSARAESFGEGVLTLIVDYSDGVPLTARLSALARFGPRVTQEGPGSLSLEVAIKGHPRQG